MVINDLSGQADGSGAAQSAADEVVKEIKAFGGEAVANYDSVTDFNGARRIIDAAINTFGKLDILVNNAGFLRDRMIFNMAEEDWDAVVTVHLKGTFNCARHACVYWRELNKAGKPVSGRIINTASDIAVFYNPSQSNYGAAKSGILAFSMIIAKEMAKYGVTCNVIVPMARTRLTATPTTGPSMGTPEDFTKKFGFDILDPDNIAPVVGYLASDDARDISGQVFRVAGGTVWLLQGWHTAGKINKKAKWMPQELGSQIKGLIAKAPPPEDVQAIMKDFGVM